MAQHEQLLLLELGNPDALPPLARPLQGRKHELQAAPCIEEPGDHFRPPTFPQEAALDQIGSPHISTMIDRDAQMIAARDPARFHCPRATGAERVHRELQRAAARRMLERALVPEPGRGARTARDLPRGVQHDTAF